MLSKYHIREFEFKVWHSKLEYKFLRIANVSFLKSIFRTKNSFDHTEIEEKLLLIEYFSLVSF